MSYHFQNNDFLQTPNSFPETSSSEFVEENVSKTSKKDIFKNLLRQNSPSKHGHHGEGRNAGMAYVSFSD